MTTALGEVIRRGPRLGLKILTAGAFAHNGPSLGLFAGFGFQQWARLSRVAEPDGVERVLVALELWGSAFELGAAPAGKRVEQRPVAALDH